MTNLETLLLAMLGNKGGGGEGGTTNYNELDNRPQVNGITLTGNKDSEDLNLVDVNMIGVSYGVAALDEEGKVPESQLPPYPNYDEELSALEEKVDKKANKTFVETVESETSVVTVPENVSGFAGIGMIGGKTVKMVNLWNMSTMTKPSATSGVTVDVDDNDVVTINAPNWTLNGYISNTQYIPIEYGKTYVAIAEHLDGRYYKKNSPSTNQKFGFQTVEFDDIDGNSISGTTSYTKISLTNDIGINVAEYTPISTSAKYLRVVAWSNGTTDGGAVIENLKLRLRIYEKTDNTIEEYVPYGNYLWNAPVESVVSQGKNLFKLNNETTRISSGVTCTYNNDGSITLDGTSTATATFPLMGSQANPVYDFATDTYSLIWSDKSDSTSESGIGLKLGDTKAAAYDGAATSSNKIYTMTGEVGYVYLRASSGRTFNNFKVYPMLVKGTAISTEYSPYNKTTVSIPQEILNLPDYGVESNVVDFENGTYTHNKTISNGEVVDYTGADKIIDITSILCPFQCESDGTITFENEHNLDMPNTVLYKKEVL